MDNSTSLRERYAARIAQRGIDLFYAAKEIGCAMDTLRRWLKGRESAYVDQHVSAWLDRAGGASAPVAPATIAAEPATIDAHAADTDDAFEAMDRLNDQNRILQGCSMLPREKKLTDEQIQTVRDAFMSYTQERGIKDAQVSREVNYGAAVISQWRAGTYKGAVDKVTHAINDWLERSKRRADAERPKDYVSTWVAESMRTFAFQAHTHSMMAAIVAPAGCGKSKVLKALTEEFRAIYVYCTPGITERELLFKIAMALGYKREIGTKVSMLNYIIEQLTGTRRTIFLDEAQQLQRAIGIVRAIFDQAECPIVMAGTAEILRYVDDRADGRGQFSSRCMSCNIIDLIRNAESPDGGKVGRDLFTIEEIQKFFKSKQMKLSGDALRLMLALACLPNQGTLRLIEKLAAIAADLNRDAERLERDHILEALELFRGASGAAYLERIIERRERESTIAKVA